MSESQVDMLKIHAPAKINLFLEILAQEVSGFHQIETVFALLEFGDTLRVEKASSGIVLDVSGISMGPMEENLAYRAADAFLREAGIEEGVRILLEKRIPMQAGLGGGSSDAGATLRALADLFPGAVEGRRLLRLAARLGSDVPLFLYPSPLVLAWGRGDRLLELPPLPSVNVLLAVPSVGVSTPEAYRLLAEARGKSSATPGPRLLSAGTFSSWDEVAEGAANDFEGVIFRKNPSLMALRDALRNSGSLFSLLSGSGSALFGIFHSADAAVEAKEKVAGEFPDTRFILTRTSSGVSGGSGEQGVEHWVGD